MGTLTRLQPDERVWLDPDCLVALYAQLGESGAEQVILRAAAELSYRLEDADRLARSGRNEALESNLRLISKMAQQIGMQSVAQVAGDVLAAVRSRDRTAQAATLARLARIGHRSLTAASDLRDMTL